MLAVASSLANLVNTIYNNILPVELVKINTTINNLNFLVSLVEILVEAYLNQTVALTYGEAVVDI